jgi:LuxR family maltose regulon positive regulatory protein
MAIPLLQTKLYIPPVRPGLVSRPRLIERLDEGLHLGRKLTLISAPAGFGKTTLLSEWIASCTRDTRIAWLSLDKGDNDLSQFLTYLVAAIQSIDPKLGEGAWAMMQSPQPPAAEPVLITLINELMERPGSGGQVAPVVLVLDDYHEVTSEPVHDALVYLLDHLPPQMHVLIATRVDPPWPLGRMRARQEMTELRAGDLRFAPEETARFLNDVMGLGLSAEDMSALDRRTEGWVAGLQMAALSMRGRDAARTEVFIRTFSGSHRYVLDYLMEEVLDRQEDEIRVFLLQTSILDRLTAPLCDAVLAGESRGTSHPRSDSRAILTWLERANLFLVPLDDERRWYRYHPLFADLLRTRFQEAYPEQVSEAHLRASAWYEGQGSITEAIAHALEAADDVRAAYLVERYSGQAFRHGEFWQSRRWVEVLPEETVRSRPLLCMGRAWALADHPDATDRAMWWMERALALSATNPCAFDGPDSAYRTDHELISENARLFHISIARRQADPKEVVALCLEALEALSAQTPPAQTLGEEAAFSRGIITFWLAQAYEQLNDKDAAARAYAQAEQLGLATLHF